MRWKDESPRRGDKRIIKTFLLFPKALKGEVRWLEMAYVLQEYFCTFTWSGWLDQKYVSKEWIKENENGAKTARADSGQPID